MVEGLGVVLGASALGAGLWTALNMAAMATVLPLSLDASWIRLLAWGLAATAGVVAAAVVTSPPAVGGRAVLGVLGAACLAGLAWSVAWAYEVDALSLVFWIVMALGGLAAAALAIRPWRATSLEGRARVAVLAATGLAGLGWGQGVLTDFAEEHADQALPGHALELAAAYPYSLEADPGRMPTVIVDGAGQIGDVLSLDGERWNVHRTDALRLAEVRRVRWVDMGEAVGVSIRVDGETRVALDERSRSRSSQYDVLYVDDEPVSTVFYFGLEPGRLVIMSRDRGALHAVYRRLTRPGGGAS